MHTAAHWSRCLRSAMSCCLAADSPSTSALKMALQCDSDWCIAFLEASSSICVKVVVELQILESGRARDVHASTVSPVYTVDSPGKAGSQT